MPTPNNVAEQSALPSREASPAFLPETSPQQTEPSEYAQETAAYEAFEVQHKSSEKREDDFLDEDIAKLNTEVQQRKKVVPNQVSQVRDPLTVKIEHIMEDGLVDAFREMTPVQQQEFKIKGEQTAIEIRHLMSQPKIKIKKIFELLLGWLKLIPGINRFFTEQEAKIKSDKIFALRLQDIT